MDEAAITARIQSLQENRRAGEEQLRRLDTQQRELQQTLLRIDGALQVLTELLDDVRRHGASGEGPE
ncbi:hypothetical protein [Burkholderia sp. 22PA0106]|uniref:hypothetical protein n=1 Tax=Burkholderia sp. 22PA0106 TaxID=3237371 RepID=UPI0039C486DA